MAIQNNHQRERVLEKFGREINNMSARTQQRWLKRAFDYWRSQGFPYPVLTTGEIAREYESLCRVEPKRVVVDGVASVQTTGLRLANSFHPQMWRIRRHGRSAVDIFNDDDVLRCVLRKCVRFYPNRRCWNGQCLRSVLRIHHRARVANFRPAVAKALYARFSRPGDLVIDPAAGFGGRLLGALTLQRRYIGIDPATQQIRGMRSMVRRLKKLSQGTASIEQACAENVLADFDSNSVDMVLTSPPYFNHEKYCRSATQSYARYNTYDDWRARFLYPIVEECHRILRPGAYCVINVANIERFSIADDVDSFARNVFGSIQKIRLLMNSLPHVRATNGHSYRTEPIFVLRKSLSKGGR